MEGMPTEGGAFVPTADDLAGIDAWFARYDALATAGDVEAMADMALFPLNLATDDAQGNGSAWQWTREQFISGMSHAVGPEGPPEGGPSRRDHMKFDPHAPLPHSAVGHRGHRRRAHRRRDDAPPAVRRPAGQAGRPVAFPDHGAGRLGRGEAGCLSPACSPSAGGPARWRLFSSGHGECRERVASRSVRATSPGAGGGRRTSPAVDLVAARRRTRSRCGRDASARRRGGGPWRTRRPPTRRVPTPSSWPRSTMNGRGAIRSAISA